jgi:hypothetical protein
MPCLGLKGQLLRTTIVPIFMRLAARSRKLQFEDSLSRRAEVAAGGASHTFGITVFSLMQVAG